ncbi:hypothetical protein KY289_026275 [Solanum tuberosum]|nr:hypothetical protein KY289_026275 [Solanum tuberosum]
MATRSETLPLKGKVTLESIIEAIVDVSWRMANIKERMASMEGASMMNGGTQVPAKEPTVKGVMDALRECPNIQGKEDLSCRRQVTIAKLSTFTIANEQSVNVNLSLCEPIASLPCVDNVLVDSMDTLVDPIDDRIDSSNPIACFAHRDHVLENALKNDMCLFMGELACFNSSRVVDHPLFKYNILFEDDEITRNDVPSGVNHENSIVFDNYTCYSNPLWFEACPPKDGNLFLEDESTLVGMDCDEKKGGVCFSITSSFWCVPIVNGLAHEFESISSHTHENTIEEVDLRDTFLYYLFTYDEAHAVEWSMLFEGKSANLVNGCALDPSTWLAFPFDPSRKLFLRFYHPLEEPTLCVGKDSFLDPFSMSYIEHDLVECASHGGRRYLLIEDQGVIVVYTCWYDPVLRTSFYPFDPGGCLRVFELMGVSSFGWYYVVVEKNDNCPCSPLVGLIAMSIDDVWLFLEFESPRLNVDGGCLACMDAKEGVPCLAWKHMHLERAPSWATPCLDDSLEHRRPNEVRRSK